MIQKHSRGWKIGLEAEMEFPVNEAYSLPMNAKSLVNQSWSTCAEAIIHDTWRWGKLLVKEC